MATDHSTIIRSKPIHLTRQKIISPMNSVKSFTRTSQKSGTSFFGRVSLKKKRSLPILVTRKKKTNPQPSAERFYVSR